jgi:hypothetical protein
MLDNNIMLKNNSQDLNESELVTSDQKSASKSESIIDKIIQDLNNRINDNTTTTIATNTNNNSKTAIMKRKSIMIESFNDESAIKEESDSTTLFSSSNHASSTSNLIDEEAAIIDSETEFYETKYKQISKKHKALHETNIDSKQEESNKELIKIDNKVPEIVSDIREEESTSSNDSNDMQSNSTSRKLKTLPVEALRIMRDWYELHNTHPYPTDEEKKIMAIQGNVNESQVKAWFANKRNRSSNTRVKKPKLLLPKPPPPTPMPQSLHMNANMTFTLPYENVNQLNNSMNYSLIFKHQANLPNSLQANHKQMMTLLSYNANNNNNNNNNISNTNYLSNTDLSFTNLSNETNDQYLNNSMAQNHRPVMLNNTSSILGPHKNRNSRKKIIKKSILNNPPNSEIIAFNNNNLPLNINKNGSNGSTELDFSASINPNLIMKNNQSSIPNRLITNTCLQPFTTKRQLSTSQNNFVSFNENIHIQNNLAATNYDYPFSNKISNIASQQIDSNNNNINIKSQQQSSDLLFNNCYFGNNNNLNIASPSNNFIYTNDFFGLNNNNNHSINHDYINENNHNYGDIIESCYCNCDCVINNSMTTTNQQHRVPFHHNHHTQLNRTPTHLNQQCNTPPPIITKANYSNSNSRCNSNENSNRKNSPAIRNDEQIDMQSFLNINATTSQSSIFNQDINLNNQFKQMYQVTSSSTPVSNCSAFKSLSNSQNLSTQFRQQPQDFNDFTFQNNNRSSSSYLFNNNNNNNNTDKFNSDDPSLDYFNQIKHSSQSRFMNDSSGKYHNQFSYLMDYQDARFTDSKAKEWCISLHPRLSSTLLNLAPSHLQQFKNSSKCTQFQSSQQQQLKSLNLSSSANSTNTTSNNNNNNNKYK